MKVSTARVRARKRNLLTVPHNIMIDEGGHDLDQGTDSEVALGGQPILHTSV